MKELLLATSNPGKIAELTAILSPMHCVSQCALQIDNAEETGLSFIENAIIKARHASQIANMPALADDSGLVVTALHGKPGIFSARYAAINASDEDNIDFLLSKLAHVADEQRSAYFYCALALVQHAADPTPLVAIGKLEGKITKHRQGKHGFGYDSIFYIPNQHCTLAELSPRVKNIISHRALAIKQLLTFLNIAEKTPYGY